MNVTRDPIVFISYSHDSDAHRERVLSLSERLRADGIPTILDRYVENRSPPEGWPRWMMNALQAATHVLCICTETYYRRFRGQEVPHKGKGVDWEGALITQSLYDARSVTNRFVPVLFDDGDEAHVPDPLRPQTHYLLNSEPNYQALYDMLLGQAGIEPGPVGPPKRRPRARARPITFPADPLSAPTDPGASTTAAPSTAAPAALVIWQAKLEFLLVEEAINVDPDMRFRLKHLIAEAEEKCRKLSTLSTALVPGAGDRGGTAAQAREEAEERLRQMQGRFHERNFYQQVYGLSKGTGETEQLSTWALKRLIREGWGNDKAVECRVHDLDVLNLSEADRKDEQKTTLADERLLELLQSLGIATGRVLIPGLLT